ncbi:MAG: hypothetical protein CMF69_02635 [Magnetovibrio sp.]|nr:hypothetical protein [Magnetovibrio sp.]|tara:strand:- start:1576 stop:2058 length:483 start_codon:yes stop_codon:yes gene_type:complete
MNQFDNQREFRNALGRFATGVTVVTTIGPSGKAEGITANSFSALSLKPPLILWCIGKSTPTYKSFITCTHFSVNVLKADQLDISRRFATASHDKFAGLDWREGAGGVPLLNDSLAAFECEFYANHEGGDHSILVGKVYNFSYTDGAPLLFNAGKYEKMTA